jgi:uncharacterized membrane protein YccC
LAIVVGVGVGAFSFHLLPPLSPAFRTRRLLQLALRDLRRLAAGPLVPTPREWEGRMYGRFSVLPDQAQPWQRSQLIAALSVGTEIVQLRRIARRTDLGAEFDAALEGLAGGHIAIAIDRLHRLDQSLADRSGAAALRARGSILAVSDALTQHSAYFSSGGPA